MGDRLLNPSPSGRQLRPTKSTGSSSYEPWNEILPKNTKSVQCVVPKKAPSIEARIEALRVDKELFNRLGADGTHIERAMHSLEHQQTKDPAKDGVDFVRRFQLAPEEKPRSRAHSTGSTKRKTGVVLPKIEIEGNDTSDVTCDRITKSLNSVLI